MWHLLFTTLVLPLEKDWWEHTPLRTKTTNPRLSERGGLGPTPSELDSTVVRKRLNSESTKLQKENQTNPCVFGCRKHFCLTQAATLSHEVQTEPKDRTVVFHKCHMFLICGQTNKIKLAFFFYNCRLIQWATALCSLCLGNFSWFLPAIRKGLFFHWRNSDQWIKDFYKIIFSHTKPNGKQAKYHYLSDSDSVNGPIHMKAH